MQFKKPTIPHFINQFSRQSFNDQCVTKYEEQKLVNSAKIRALNRFVHIDDDAMYLSASSKAGMVAGTQPATNDFVKPKENQVVGKPQSPTLKIFNSVNLTISTQQNLSKTNSSIQKQLNPSYWEPTKAPPQKIIKAKSTTIENQGRSLHNNLQKSRKRSSSPIFQLQLVQFQKQKEGLRTSSRAIHNTQQKRQSYGSKARNNQYQSHQNIHTVNNQLYYSQISQYNQLSTSSVQQLTHPFTYSTIFPTPHKFPPLQQITKSKYCYTCDQLIGNNSVAGIHTCSGSLANLAGIQKSLANFKQMCLQFGMTEYAHFGGIVGNTGNYQELRALYQYFMARRNNIKSNSNANSMGSGSNLNRSSNLNSTSSLHTQLEEIILMRITNIIAKKMGIVFAM